MFPQTERSWHDYRAKIGRAAQLLLSYAYDCLVGASVT